jgi:hypothetical protein
MARKNPATHTAIFLLFLQMASARPASALRRMVEEGMVVDHAISGS